MKTLVNIALIAFILIVNHSCKNSNEDKGIEKISLSCDTLSTVPLSSIVQSLSYIPLMENDGGLLGAIEEVKIFDGKIYVRHDIYKPRIFVFSMEGKFLYQLGNPGSGPDEYVLLQDFGINEQAKEVELLDLSGRKILHFDTAGNLVRKTAIPVMPFSFTHTSNGYLFYLGNYVNEMANSVVTSNVLGYSSEMEATCSAMPITPTFSGFLQVSTPTFSCHKDQITLIQTLCDTIFWITDCKAKPRFVLDFGSKACDFMQEANRFTSPAKGLLTSTLKRRDIAFCPEYFYEFANVIHFTYYYHKPVTVFYSKAKKTVVEGGQVVNDIDGVPFGKVRGAYDDLLISCVEPMVIQLNRDKIKTTLLPMLSRSGNGNPVLMLTKMK